MTEDGPLRIEVTRDRDASFEPLLIPKHEWRFTGFDDKDVAMYARGMTVREVQGFLADQYSVEVSSEFISSVTDADGRGWRLAGPPTGADVPGGVPRRAARQNLRGYARA